MSDKKKKKKEPKPTVDNQQIIDATDIESIIHEFYPPEKLTGIKNGWYEVKALFRDDNSASAGINLESGVYHDFAETGATSLFDWLAATGHFDNWYDARNELASRANIEVPKSKKQKAVDNKEKWEDLLIYSHLPLSEMPLYARGLIKRKPGITNEALIAFGGKAAKYDNFKYENVESSRQKVNIVVAIPVYNVRAPRPDKVPLVGVSLYPNDGTVVYQTQGDPLGILSRGTAGLIGKHGLEILMHQEKRKNVIWVIKTEGPSDAIALWAAMSPEDRDLYPILTNSNGCAENVNEEYWARFLKGLPLCTIHDSDQPGQKGIENWQEKIAPSCSKYINVVLHDEIVEKKGKDLRDWLNEGGSWLELKAMIHNSPIVMVGKAEDVNFGTDNEKLLDRIGCTVIGDLGGAFNRIQIYSKIRREYFDIIPMRLNEYDMGQMFGEDIGDKVSRDVIALDTVKSAISARASEVGRVNQANRIGPGIWCSRDKARLAIVGEQGLFTYDESGGLDLQEDPRFDGNAALLRTDGFTQPWFDEDKLRKYVRMAESDRDWSIAALFELNNVFLVWDNLHYGSDDAFLLTGLTVATILQDIWEIRPQVWLSGPTDSGKSHMTRVLESLFPLLLARMDAPTEAGFRNAIQNQKRFCTIDEFEKSVHRKKIIETLRSTTKGGVVLKATSDHRTVSFKIKHLPWFTGTNRGFEKFAADTNRVIKLDLGEPTPEQYARGQVFPSEEALRDLGHKVYAVAIVHWKKMLEMEKALSRLSIPGMAHRLIECYAVPTAALAAVMDYDAAGAENMLSEMLHKRADDVMQSSSADEERMVEFILGQPIRVGGAEYPLGYLAQTGGPLPGANSDISARDIAGMNGVRQVLGGDWFFHENTIQSREWWRKSEYVGVGIKESLGRLIPSQKLVKGKLRHVVQLVSKSGNVRAVRVPAVVMQPYVGEHQLELGFNVPKSTLEQKGLPLSDQI